MLYYNFKDNQASNKQFLDLLKEVEMVISPYKRLDASPDDCTIIEWGQQENLHVAYPPSSVGEVSFTHFHKDDLGSKWKGYVLFPGTKFKRTFSLRDGVLYIGKVAGQD